MGIIDGELYHCVYQSCLFSTLPIFVKRRVGVAVTSRSRADWYPPLLSVSVRGRYGRTKTHKIKTK